MPMEHASTVYIEAVSPEIMKKIVEPDYQYLIQAQVKQKYNRDNLFILIYRLSPFA